MANFASPPVGAVTEFGSLSQTLKGYVSEHIDTTEGWIIGFGYDDSLLAEGTHPTRRNLDQVSAERPIALLHVSGHLIAANSKALEIAGITADTDDPAGGHIQRFSGTAETNGVLEETAMSPVHPYIFGGQGDPIASIQTAFLSRPYHVPPAVKNAEYRGYPTHTPEHVTTMVGYCLNAGVPILAHANGDAAADMLIDAVA